jgi:ADP-ribose pyrophosphatase
MEATLEQLFRELEDGSLHRGDWKAGEVEITGMVGMVANRFWVEVEYAVLFPPKVAGNDPVAGSYRMIVWTSGAAAGAGVLMFTPNWEVLLVRQFRHATRSWEIELPRGARLPGESSEKCALREGKEEVGGIPTEASRIEDMGSINPDTGILRSNIGLVAVTNVTINESAQDRDVSESHLGIIKVNIQEFLAMINRGEITCGITLAAFTKAVARGIIPTHLLAA